ncbi:MAG: SRPBCC domain-containing protein [Bacteroidetes bacterium]|nr:SRPBCC domain-containing protein [Bacteroidota bacterium]
METTQELVITRIYNAPRKLVYKAWSDAEALAQWWGPAGMTLTVKKLDFRPGGIFHYGMGLPNGAMMWGIFKYRDIKEPEQIVFVNSFADEDGNITRAPFHPAWPLEILNKLVLEEHDGKTTMTLSGGPVNATKEEFEVFAASIPQMEGGFKGTFDQLEAFLAKNQ